MIYTEDVWVFYDGKVVKLNNPVRSDAGAVIGTVDASLPTIRFYVFYSSEAEAAKGLLNYLEAEQRLIDIKIGILERDIKEHTAELKQIDRKIRELKGE